MTMGGSIGYYRALRPGLVDETMVAVGRVTASVMTGGSIGPSAG